MSLINSNVLNRYPNDVLLELQNISPNVVAETTEINQETPTQINCVTYTPTAPQRNGGTQQDLELTNQIEILGITSIEIQQAIQGLSPKGLQEAINNVQTTINNLNIQLENQKNQYASTLSTTLAPMFITITEYLHNTDCINLKDFRDYLRSESMLDNKEKSGCFNLFVAYVTELVSEGSNRNFSEREITDLLNKGIRILADGHLDIGTSSNINIPSASALLPSMHTKVTSWLSQEVSNSRFASDFIESLSNINPLINELTVVQQSTEILISNFSKILIELNKAHDTSDIVKNDEKMLIIENPSASITLSADSNQPMSTTTTTTSSYKTTSPTPKLESAELSELSQLVKQTQSLLSRLEQIKANYTNAKEIIDSIQKSLNKVHCSYLSQAEIDDFINELSILSQKPIGIEEFNEESCLLVSSLDAKLKIRGLTKGIPFGTDFREKLDNRTLFYDETKAEKEKQITEKIDAKIFEIENLAISLGIDVDFLDLGLLIDTQLSDEKNNAYSILSKGTSYASDFSSVFKLLANSKLKPFASLLGILMGQASVGTTIADLFRVENGREATFSALGGFATGVGLACTGLGLYLSLSLKLWNEATNFKNYNSEKEYNEAIRHINERFCRR